MKPVSTLGPKTCAHGRHVDTHGHTDTWARGHAVLSPPPLLHFCAAGTVCVSGAAPSHERHLFTFLLAQGVRSRKLKWDPQCSGQPCVSCGLWALM